VPLTIFLIASGIFLWLGVAHAALLLRDLRGPRAFTPTDPSVRDAMAEARLRALLYAVLASLFWFRVPALAAWLGCALFLAAAVLR
jgi:hypothetical protein